MIWPFLMIYSTEKLGLSLTIVAGLMTFNSAMGLIFSLIAGPIIDRAGRKWIMVFSLALHGISYFFLGKADTLLEFYILMGLSGAVGPLYRIGANAMIADLLPDKDRIDGYALFRMTSNAAIALGPAIGGFLATSSYSLAFTFATIGLSIYALLISIFAKETLPKNINTNKESISLRNNYTIILKDKPFLKFIFAFLLTQLCSSLIWVLLAVYMKTYFGIPENQFGFIPTTNAIMVVTLQVLITRFTKKHKPSLIMALGSFLYGIGVGSVALGNSFWGFWVSMIIMTIGELIIMPTSNAYVAKLAPDDMRGRYMGLFSLTWGVAAGIAPVTGGLMSDNFGFRSPWISAFFLGTLSALVFLSLYKSQKNKQISQT